MAVQLDGQDPFNRYALGRALILARRHDSAVLELGKAIELNPSFAQAHYALSMALATGGRPEEALPHIELAMRLSPQDPYFGQFLVRRAEAYLFLGRLEEAVESAERSLREPNVQWSRWAILAAAQAHLGRPEDARRSIEALRAAAASPWVDIDLVRLNPIGSHMDADPDTVISVIKKMRADGKGIVGMKILGQGDMRDKPSEAIRYALSTGVLDAPARLSGRLVAVGVFQVIDPLA